MHDARSWSSCYSVLMDDAVGGGRFGRALVCLAMAGLGGCSDDDGAAVSEASSDSGGGSTTLADGSTTSAESEGASGSDEGLPGDDGIGGECSVWEQDCPEGDKCTPWSDQPDLVPDEIRCCPEVATPRQPGDTCTVEGYFGSCIDDCVEGSLCLDIDGDGQGVCQAFCQGSADDPQCATDESCLIYFSGIPFCFRQCDPLLQDCAEGEGCYPDEASAGGTGFICLPTVGGVGYGELCWLLSGCERGLICVTPDFLPDCVGSSVGCCTTLCDTSEPDACADVHPDLECVSWYYAGQTPPTPELANVGACALPPS